MKRSLNIGFATGALVIAASLLSACAGEVMNGQGGSKTDGGTGPKPDLAPPPVTQQEHELLASRQVNLGLALRTASLKLRGELPSLAEQDAIARAPNPRLAYEQQIDKYLAEPRFADTLVGYHRNVFKTGGGGTPSRETAAVFATEVVMKDRPYTDIFTASTKTCPTFDRASGNFTDADCNNGTTPAGVLTDPGVQAHFYGNMAFRRARWVQETFACRKFPAEYTRTPVPMGAGQYTAPWPFASITGGKGAPVDFHDTSSVICANCHATMNHLAPMFANFDTQGRWMDTVQVKTPIMGTPATKMTDWLPAGEKTAWRFGNEVSNLPALGKALAADKDVIDCTVARVWDYAMSKGDIVADLATVPESVLAPLRDVYVTSGHDFKKTLRAAFTSDDFVKF